MPSRIWPILRRRAGSEQLSYVLARAQLHQALNHLNPAFTGTAWHAACWYHVEAILSGAGIGELSSDIPPPPTGVPRLDEPLLIRHFEEEGIPTDVRGLSLGESAEPFWRFSDRGEMTPKLCDEHTAALGRGIRAASTAVLTTAYSERVDSENVEVE